MSDSTVGNTTVVKCSPLPVTFDATAAFGPWFVGLGIELLLTGVAFNLVLSYIRHHAATDRLAFRVFVAVLMTLVSLKTLDGMAIGWYSLIAGHGSNRMAGGSQLWCTKIHPILTAVISLIAQSFFLVRLKAILTTKRWLLILVIIFMLLSMLGFLTVTIQLFLLSPRDAVIQSKRPQIVAQTGLIGADIMLCGIFTYVLSNSRTGVKRTDSILARLIFLSFASAGVPTLVDACKLVAVLAFTPKSTAFLTFTLVQSVVYTIAVLVTLNFRSSLRNNETVFFTTRAGAIFGRSIHLDASSNLVSYPDFPRPIISQSTASNNERSGGGGQSVIESTTSSMQSSLKKCSTSVTVGMEASTQDDRSARLREQELIGEQTETSARIGGYSKQYVDVCECGKSRQGRLVADG